MELAHPPRPPAPVLFIRLAAPKIPQALGAVPRRVRRRLDRRLSAAVGYTCTIVRPLPRRGDRRDVRRRGCRSEIHRLPEDERRGASDLAERRLRVAPADVATGTSVRAPDRAADPRRGRRVRLGRLGAARAAGRTEVAASWTARTPSARSSPGWLATELAAYGSPEGLAEDAVPPERRPAAVVRRGRRAAPRSATSSTRASASRGRASSPSRTEQACGSAALARQLVALLPLRPRARVEAALAAGEVEAVERDARGDARAAVGDELARRQLGQRLVPGRVERAGDAARHAVDRVRLAAPARRRAARRRRRARSRRAASSSRLDRVARRARAARTSPARRAPRRRVSGPRQASRSITAQASWPKWRSSHQSRSAPPSVPYATTNTPAPIPARAGGAAKSSAAGSGCRPPAPGGADRSRSTSRNTAPGMCPARYCARPQAGSSSDQRQSTKQVAHRAAA